MDPARLAAPWHPLADDAITGMAEWRVHHPQATLRAIIWCVVSVPTHSLEALSAARFDRVQ